MLGDDDYTKRPKVIRYLHLYLRVIMNVTPKNAG